MMAAMQLPHLISRQSHLISYRLYKLQTQHVTLWDRIVSAICFRFVHVQLVGGGLRMSHASSVLLAVGLAGFLGVVDDAEAGVDVGAGRWAACSDGVEAVLRPGGDKFKLSCTFLAGAVSAAAALPRKEVDVRTGDACRSSLEL
jgi:hypothetical protein